MQYIDLYSCRTVQLPSVWLSQKHELAVCSPAPFFCMMIQLTANATAAKSNYQIQRPARCRRRTARPPKAIVQHGAHSPIYLKGFCRPVNFFITPSITSEVHCGTFSCSYVACCAPIQQQTTAVSRPLRSTRRSLRCAEAVGMRGTRNGGVGTVVTHRERGLHCRLHLLLHLLLHKGGLHHAHRGE